MLIGAYLIRIIMHGYTYAYRSLFYKNKNAWDIPMLIGAYFIRIRMHGYTYAYRSLLYKNKNAWIYLCL